jgi:hypothetical protein
MFPGGSLERLKLTIVSGGLYHLLAKRPVDTEGVVFGGTMMEFVESDVWVDHRNLSSGEVELVMLVVPRRLSPSTTRLFCFAEPRFVCLPSSILYLPTYVCHQQ